MSSEQTKLINVGGIFFTLDNCLRNELLPDDVAAAVEEAIENEKNDQLEIAQDFKDEVEALIEKCAEILAHVEDRLELIRKESELLDEIEPDSYPPTWAGSTDVVRDHVKKTLEDLQDVADRFDDFKESHLTEEA